jgi:4'-phosphopantetheinyl transferase
VIKIDLWYWSLDLADPVNTDSRFQDYLSSDEKERANRFVKPRDKERFTRGRGRMREILAGYLNRDASTLQFDITGNGKPVLAEGPAFNLSHSGGWAVLVVAEASKDLLLGIDIEAYRPVEQGIATRVFSKAEQAALGVMARPEWEVEFFRGWTRKEAVIKATAQGFSADLSSFDVSLGPSAEVLRADPPLPSPERWYMLDLDLPQNFAGAVVGVTEGEKLALRNVVGQIKVY